MNYTYLPSSPYSPTPVIVMTTSAASKKMNNLVANPNVSLLVHDCTSSSYLPISLLSHLTPTLGAIISPSPPLTHLLNLPYYILSYPPTLPDPISHPCL